MFDVPASIDYIIDKINEWDKMIKLNNKNSLFNINNFSENFYRDIFNIILNLKLENANLFKNNEKSIDLKDALNSIAIQVTSDNSLEKIRHTVEEFIDNGYNNDFRELKICVLDFKPKSKRNDYAYKGYTFEMKNVIFYEDLIKYIKDCAPKKIFEIRYLFEVEYQDIKNELEAHELKEEIKKSKYLDNEIVKRNLIKLSNYDKYYSYVFNKEYIDIYNILSKDKKIIILGEAASGKTYLLKSIADSLNSDDLHFAFYCKLNTYIDKELDTFIPDKYSIINKNRIVLILDGLDEIEEKYKGNFFKRLKDFNNKNIDTAVIISCRNNSYKNEKNLLEEYQEYLLGDFNDEELLNFLQLKNINYNDFMKKIENKDYGSMVKNPFYLNILCDFYIANTSFPKKTEFLSKSIEHIFSKDKNKYTMSLYNIDDIQKLQRTAIQKLGFILECLGRNYLSDDELRTFINRKDYRYIKYCGLISFNNNNWSFIHNNFGEYLASLELAKLTKDEFELAVLNKKNKKIKYSWYNTVAFYIMNTPNNTILEYTLKNNPELVFNVEKDKIPEDKKKLIFKKILDYYMINKIWIPAQFLYNNKFIEFFSVTEVYEYLCDIIIKNEHYVKTHNALEIMINMINYISSNRIFEIINKSLYLKDYSKDDKKNFLYILANGGYGDESFLRKIIEDLKNEEEQYLRTGYFYYINKMNLVDSMIKEIFNFKSSVGKIVVAKWKNDDNDDDESNITLADEHFEFSKMFKNIKQIESINFFIEELKKDENKRERFDKEIIENLCFSIDSLDVDSENKANLIFQLYFIFLENYNRDCSSYLLTVIDKKSKRLELFKYYLKNNIEYSRYQLLSFIDANCAIYFHKNYKENVYTNELAELVVTSLAYGTKEYNLIKEEYESRTNKKIPTPYIPLTESEKNIFHQECFNSIFNKTDFRNLIYYFFDSLHLDKIVVDEILSTNHDHWDDVKFQYISYTLYHAFSDKEIIIEKSKIDDILDKWNWDVFIIEETVDFLENYDTIKINDIQQNEINRICNGWLKDIDFKTAITYTSPSSSNINIRCLRLAYLRKKLNLKFPENILLDMLEFELIENGRNIGVGEIIIEVGYEKCKTRILNNLKNKELLGDILENHIQFCIENNIYENIEEIYNYFFSEKLSNFTKSKCFEYLIKSKKTKYISNLFKKVNNFDGDLWNHISNVLSQNMNKNVLKILTRLLKKSNNDNIKMFIYCEMIKRNIYLGVKEYYKWMKLNKKTYSDDLNGSIKNIKGLRFIIINLKMLQLTFNKGFKDRRFSSLYNNVSSSIVLIGKKNEFYKSIVKLLINFFILINRKHKHIGFVNYILIDLETNTETHKEEMSIIEIKKLLKA
jgi:hypothetical protein